MTSLKRRIAGALQNGGATAEQVAEQLGEPVGATRLVLAELVSLGFAQQQADGRYWRRYALAGQYDPLTHSLSLLDTPHA